MVQGQCNCGAVAFEINAEISPVIVCHCSICRKSTGSNGISVVVFPTNTFKWTRGETNISIWKKPDADWQTCFCKDCGSRLPGLNDDTRMYAPAGLLTGDGAPQTVVHHIWVGSKAEWDEIGDTGLQHPEAFGTANISE